MFYTTHSFDVNCNIDREPSDVREGEGDRKFLVGPFVNFVKIRVHGGRNNLQDVRQISRRASGDRSEGQLVLNSWALLILRAPSAAAAVIATTSSADCARAAWNSERGLLKQRIAAGVTTQHRCRC
jgi:hypothetical protein